MLPRSEARPQLFSYKKDPGTRKDRQLLGPRPDSQPKLAVHQPRGGQETIRLPSLRAETGGGDVGTSLADILAYQMFTAGSADDLEFFCRQSVQHKT